MPLVIGVLVVAAFFALSAAIHVMAPYIAVAILFVGLYLATSKGKGKDDDTGP